MESKLVTIAIHQNEKANIAKKLLESRGVSVLIEEIRQELPHGNISLGFHVKVKEEDVNAALTIIGSSKALSYTDQGVFQFDDGRGRILVAVDFSEYSLKACKIAFQIAKATNAKVKILNVFPNLRYPLHIPFSDIVRGEEDESILGKARNKMLTLCQEINNKIIAGEIPSVNYSYSLREGIVEEEIENFIEEYKPLLLVVGTKGASNNPKNFVGNVTADIIEITNVPVLAIPLGEKSDNLTSIKHMVYLTNVDKRDLESFDSLVKMIHGYSSKVKVTLIHFNNTPKGGRFSEEQLANMREYFQLRYPSLEIGYKLIDTDEFIDSLDEFVTKEEVGMICLNTRKRNIIGRIFMPSMSRKLLRDLDIPLMILRD